MTGPFVYNALAGRVVFGNGRRHELPAELDALGAERVMVIGDPFDDALATRIEAVLGDRAVGRFSEVVQHVPVVKAEAARAMATELRADAVLTIGGGSATGFGKAVRLTHDLAFIALPTTYAGSEMTTIYGMTDGDHKQTGIDARVKPDTVIYDPELTVSLPPRIAGPSGMNALAHCVEALYGPGANPIISLMALEGIAALHQGLPAIVADPTDVDARGDAFYGAYLAGVALATGGTALHHKTCHVLGGMFDLNHGDMNSVVLGHAVAYNAPVIPELMERMGVVLGVAADAVPGAFYDLAVAIGAPTSLADIGMPADGIEEAARRVVIAAAANVRTPDYDSVRQMLEHAHDGSRPEVRP